MFNLYYVSGNIFKELKYTNSDDLIETLNAMLKEYSYNYQFIQLILNDDIINNGTKKNNFNYYCINNLEKELLETDFVQVIFIDKRKVFCLKEINGKCILNTEYKNIFNIDFYYYILQTIIYFYEDSYNIIMNSTYRELIILVLKKNGLLIESLGVDMRNDKELVLEAVKQNGNSLDVIDLTMQNDKDVVIEAVKNCGRYLYLASSEMKNNKDVILQAIKSTSSALRYASNNIKNNKEIILAALEQDQNEDDKAGILEFVSLNLKNDKDVVLAAVKKYGKDLEFASLTLKEDKDIIIEAIYEDINSIKFISPSINFRKDKYIILELIKRNPFYLRLASNKLRNDKDIVLAAVKQNILVLDFEGYSKLDISL